MSYEKVPVDRRFGRDMWVCAYCNVGHVEAEDVFLQDGDEVICCQCDRRLIIEDGDE